MIHFGKGDLVCEDLVCHDTQLFVFIVLTPKAYVKRVSMDEIGLIVAIRSHLVRVDPLSRRLRHSPHFQLNAIRSLPCYVVVHLQCLLLVMLAVTRIFLFNFKAELPLISVQ